LNEKRLAGFALLAEGRVVGYCFYFHDAEKALIGDLFTTPDGKETQARYLLESVLKSLVRAPGISRVETQLLHFRFEELAPLFRAHGFQGYRRRFMLLPLKGHDNAYGLSDRRRPAEGDGKSYFFGDFHILPWKMEHNREVARLIYEAYRRHVDALINDQYSHPAGTLRLVENILQQGSCGEFLPAASHVAIYQPTGKLAAALALTAVRPQTAHIPQVAVTGEFQGLGLGTTMMRTSFVTLAKLGFQEVSLTVTDLNVGAVRLYERLGFHTLLDFGAFAWSGS